MAVKGASFDILEGSCLAIVGESGSGKTTLGRCLAGLHQPTAGEMLFADAPVPRSPRLRDPSVRRRIQIVFQDPDGLAQPEHDGSAQPAASAAPVLQARAGRRAATHCCAAPAGRIGAGTGATAAVRAQRRPEAKGRHSRALAAEPDLLICDEITSALDVLVQASIVALLADLQRRTGMAMLFISHELGVVHAVSDHVAIMHQGRLIEAGETAAVFAAPRQAYTRSLLAAAQQVAAGDYPFHLEATQAGGKPMKISAVDAFRVAPKFLFVRVRTDEGVTGWGEAGARLPLPVGGRGGDRLGEYLIGKDPLAIEAHWQIMRKSGFYRDGTVLMSALAALDEALWDITGKVRGVPVHELLGGPVRDRVRAYVWIADSDFCAYTAEALIAETQGWIAKGFTAFKLTPAQQFHIGKPSEAAVVVDRIAALREAVGPDIDIAVDVHGQWSKAMARRILPLLDPYQLMFIEEPVLPEHLHMLPGTALTSTPLATGERLFSRWTSLGVLRDGISVIQPDVSDAGGISETRRIAALAEPYDVVVAPHCPLGPIALAASLQIDFATPNILIQEQSITHYGKSFFDYVLDRRVFETRDGWFSRPTGPGLGVEIDEKAVEAAGKLGFDMPNPIRFHADGSYAEF